ncbi:MAG: DUF4199 domain-containing protein [Bacteroidia bacterium]|nr:DUF4199 domain-containing protein [Bacteroidia bacterium]
MDKSYFQNNPYFYSAIVGWILGILLILWSYFNDNIHSPSLAIAFTVLYFLLFVIASVWIFRKYPEHNFLNWFIFGIITGIVAGVVYGIGYYVRAVYLEPDYTAKALDAAINHWTESGLDKKVLKRQPQFGPEFQNPGSWAVQLANFTAIIAAIIALITGGIMKVIQGKKK